MRPAPPPPPPPPPPQVDDPERLAAAIAALDAQGDYLRQLRNADIARRLAQGERQSSIARRYGIARPNINVLAKRLAAAAAAAPAD